MSKSYAKYKTLGICYGNNTPWYRKRRKHQRRINKNRLRDTFAKFDKSDIDDNFNPFDIPKEDKWREPTDGHWKANAKIIKKLCKRNKINYRNGYYGTYLTKNGKKIKK